MPIPPAFAIAIAIFDSVTVSIAEDKNGTFNFTFSVSLSETSVSDGNTFEYRGSNNTSSKVKDFNCYHISYTIFEIYKVLKILQCK